MSSVAVSAIRERDDSSVTPRLSVSSSAMLREVRSRPMPVVPSLDPAGHQLDPVGCRK